MAAEAEVVCAGAHSRCVPESLGRYLQAWSRSYFLGGCEVGGTVDWFVRGGGGGAFGGTYPFSTFSYG